MRGSGSLTGLFSAVFSAGVIPPQFRGRWRAAKMQALDNGTDMPVVVPSTRNQLHRPPSTTAPRAEVKGARVAAFVSCIPLMQPGCQGNCSLRGGRQNGQAPSTSNRPPTTMNTRVTEKPARKCGRV